MLAYLDIRTGKITRLKYFICLIVLQAVETAALMAVNKPPNIDTNSNAQPFFDGPMITVPPYFFAAIGAFLYIYSLLDARRLRDIGISPWLALFSMFMHCFTWSIFMSSSPFVFFDLLETSLIVKNLFYFVQFIAFLYIILLLFSKSNSALKEESMP